MRFEDEIQHGQTLMAGGGECQEPECEDPPPKHGRELTFDEPKEEVGAAEAEEEPSESGPPENKFGREVDVSQTGASQQRPDKPSESGDDTGPKTGRDLETP